MDRLAQLSPFIYRGQPAPLNITSARIDPSIHSIPEETFLGCEQLTDVEVNERLRRIGKGGFQDCTSLTGFNFKPLSSIGPLAFANCISLGDIEFGNKLEIGPSAFISCTSIRRIKIPTITTIEAYVFSRCRNLTDVEIGKGLTSIGPFAFNGCTALRRIKLASALLIGHAAFLNCEHLTEFDAPLDLRKIGDVAFQGCTRLVRISIPLNDGMFGQNSRAFTRCPRLARVELVGDIHDAISLLGLKEWQHAMNEEIERINLFLPGADDKSSAIQNWFESVQGKMNRYKLEHNKLLKESLSLLELLLWKIKVDELEKNMLEAPTKKAKIDHHNERKETNTFSSHDMRARCRLDCNATVIIGNVLPFLYKFKDI